MQTYTHFLWALALSKCLGRFLETARIDSGSNSGSATITDRIKKLPPWRLSGWLFGSILPDLPLIVTTIVCMVADKINQQLNLVHQLFHDWYFHSIWVKTEHNLFHSQVTLITMLFVTFALWQHRSRLLDDRHDHSSPPRRGFAPWFFWTLCSSWFHATCDIPVHHDDGPLIFFPLSTEYRFRSPVSYWDRNYHGRAFSICEHTLDLVILLWVCWNYHHFCSCCRRSQSQNTSAQCKAREDDIDRRATSYGEAVDDRLDSVTTSSSRLVPQNQVELTALVP